MEKQNEATEANAPVVIIKKKRKKKYKYSPGLKHFQQSTDAVGRGAHRLTRAVSDGYGEYRKQRKKSARKKRDGAIIDWAPNMAKFYGKTIRRASKLPLDMTNAVYTKQSKKFMKRVTKAIGRMGPF